MSYPDELGRALASVGIGGALRGRIIAEIRDHLQCDPNADLGPPAELARQFANELGTERSRRAALAASAALALAGVLFLIAFTAAVSGFPRRHPHSELLGRIGAGLAALGAQVAFVAGTLALVRALRARRTTVLPRAVASILIRRAGIGLGAGLMAMGGLALLAIEYDRGISRSSVTFALVVLASARLRCWHRHGCAAGGRTGGHAGGTPAADG
ncbi:MAG: hypothetical protein JO372_14690 [Solirubrobacterales bacterium]|nr:hypothetical protein [Solirubrobacterales bacterium]